ncbi:cornichon [Blyttiomyces helicus]|uniref:Cornichon n=1 Tax=Blyttiomyces helicus TaxID=388810 RepID=A0A4P9W8I0_9FUNG|nr:cornichon [Blyttiomyces helicus]|eukprot:RKO86476.1 cornichon [Blyttiomyces helicus]
MNAEGFLFLFAVVMAAVLLFSMVFFIIMFSDLECDYINPIDLCNKLNQFVLPEHLAHGFLFLMFLVNGSWMALLINTPLAAWHVNKIMNNRHMYDATEIFRTLPQHKKESFIKLGFYLLCFFYYLYRMILGLLQEKW